MPCIGRDVVAMWRHLEFSCYKIMSDNAINCLQYACYFVKVLYMDVLDMLNLLIFCMSDGVLSMIGAVYCSAPNFLYIKGAFVLGKRFVIRFVKIFDTVKCRIFTSENYCLLYSLSNSQWPN